MTSDNIREPLVSPSLSAFKNNSPEEWQPITINGVRIDYEISNFGRVKTLRNSNRHHRGDVLNLHLNAKGYPIVTLVYQGKHHTIAVHKLVALFFVPNTLSLPEINHKDENKTNNRADNLEWCNRSYNVQYGTGITRRTRTLSRPLCQYNYNGELVRTWPSVKDAARQNNLDASCLTRCAEGMIRTFKGYIWLYQDNKNSNLRLKECLNWLRRGHNSSYGKKLSIEAVDESGVIVHHFSSLRGAEAYGFRSSAICRAIKKRQRHFGLYWRYSD